MSENKPEDNPSDNPEQQAEKREKCRQYDMHMRDALHDFLRRTNNVGTAGQFEEFIATNYPILIQDIMREPDICEAYMERYHYIQADNIPEVAFDAQERYMLARAAYRDFPGD